MSWTAINLYCLLPVFGQQWPSFGQQQTFGQGSSLGTSFGPPLIQQPSFEPSFGQQSSFDQGSPFGSSFGQQLSFGQKPSSSQQPAVCEQMSVRKEFSDASQQERYIFFSTLRTWAQMKGNGSLHDFSMLHHINSEHTHEVPCFLPWHRKFIKLAEIALKKINPAFVMLYWDWTKDNRSPHRSIVWHSSYLGGNGRSWDKIVQDGVFGGIELEYPSKHYLRRDWDRGTGISSFHSAESIKMLIDGSSNFQQIWHGLQYGPHAEPHDNIGGVKGDGKTMYSTNDPFFWLHHATIDWIWWTWQQSNGARGFEYYTDWGVNQSELMPPWNTPVSEYMNASKPPACYYYDKLFDCKLPNIDPWKTQTFFSGPSQRTKKVTKTSFSFSKKTTKYTFISIKAKNVQKVADDIESGSLPNFDVAFDDDKAPDELIRIPKPITKEFIKMNRLNETLLREYEVVYNYRIQAFNAQIAMENNTINEYFIKKWETSGSVQLPKPTTTSDLEKLPKPTTTSDLEKLPKTTTSKSGKNSKQTITSLSARKIKATTTSYPGKISKPSNK